MTPEEQERLTRVEDRAKSNTRRIDAMEKSQEALNRLAAAVEVMATEQKHQTEGLAELKADVADLTEKVEAVEQKPAKRWDGMVDKFMAGLVGAVATLIIAGIVYLIRAGVGG